MYCCRALLTLHQTTTEANVDAALHHLRMLSADCFAEPLAEGGSTTTSPDLSPSLPSCLHTLTLSPLHMFYTNAEQLQREILETIQTPTGNLEAIAQKLSACLQRTPQDFGATELKITESKEAVDISHPDAAFIVVSCTNDKSSSQPSRCVGKFTLLCNLCCTKSLLISLLHVVMSVQHPALVQPFVSLLSHVLHLTACP